MQQYLSILFVLVASTGLAQAGEVTSITQRLDGFTHFTDIHVFVDGCNDAGRHTNDYCSLEGFRYPCCPVTIGKPVVGQLTMVSHDAVNQGQIRCQVSNGGRADACQDNEFCNGLNTTCPLNGDTPVSFDFSFDTDDWYPTTVGSRFETFMLKNSNDEDMLHFSMHFGAKR